MAQVVSEGEEPTCKRTIKLAICAACSASLISFEIFIAMFAASSAASHADDAALVASSTKALLFFAESATAANGRAH